MNICHLDAELFQGYLLLSPVDYLTIVNIDFKWTTYEPPYCQSIKTLLGR